MRNPMKRCVGYPKSLGASRGLTEHCRISVLYLRQRDPPSVHLHPRERLAEVQFRSAVSIRARIRVNGHRIAAQLSAQMPR